MHKYSNKIQIWVLYKNEMRFFMTENHRKPHRHVEMGRSHHYFCHYWLTSWTSLNFWDRTKQSYSQSFDCLEAHYLWFIVFSSIHPLSAKYWLSQGQGPTQTAASIAFFQISILSDAQWLGRTSLLVAQNSSHLPSQFYFRDQPSTPPFPCGSDPADCKVHLHLQRWSHDQFWSVGISHLSVHGHQLRDRYMT